jgi:hypothetical protein
LFDNGLIAAERFILDQALMDQRSLLSIARSLLLHREMQGDLLNSLAEAQTEYAE